MGIRAALLVLAATAVTGCYREARPESLGAAWEVTCPALGGRPELLADFSAWRPVSLLESRETRAGWRLQFASPPPGVYRLHCLGPAGSAPPVDFDWYEQDDFGGRNAVLLVPPGGDSEAARPLEKRTP